MAKFEGLVLPSIVKVEEFERNAVGQTNDVYLCRGRFRSRETRFVIKVSKRADLEIFNEYRILEAVSRFDVPAPKPLFKGESGRAYIVLDYLPGHMLWDLVDPRRTKCERAQRLEYLELYGEALARIHALPLEWRIQKRATLYHDFQRRLPPRGRFGEVLAWLEAHAVEPKDMTFVFTHGDLNVTNVLISCDRVSGILDWEFAGKGWREYDIAYAIRARPAFLNNATEREAALRGYRRVGEFDESRLQWCEALNYLHYANREKDADSAAQEFFLDCAVRAMNRG